MSIVSCYQSPRILALDVGGRPSRWLPWQAAATLHCRGQIAWEAGETLIRVRGGMSRLTGEQTELLISSIIAVEGHLPKHNARLTPPLTNRALFRRDQHLCMYCGIQLPTSQLTRDHIIPRVRSGLNRWENVATACLSCNHKKGARTPDEAGMALLAVPYAPNMAEWLVLSNRRILVDQMDFLVAHVPKARQDKVVLNLANGKVV